MLFSADCASCFDLKECMKSQKVLFHFGDLLQRKRILILSMTFLKAEYIFLY